MQGLIFNIQRYSIHDGGGIRTIVFFKGCPLTCPWCCNPESQSFQAEYMKLKSQCIACGICRIQPDECPSGALVKQGLWMTVDEVLAKVVKDEVFYTTSQGGVTLSGGEVLSQGEFAAELLCRVKQMGIHTAIETSGAGDWCTLHKLAHNTDLILYDLKIMDAKSSKNIIGISSEQILGNFTRLINSGYRVLPRIPLIPDYTMTEENLNAALEFLSQNRITEVHLLPFHQYGISKYESLGRKYRLQEIQPPSDEAVQTIRQDFEKAGLSVAIGGK